MTEKADSVRDGSSDLVANMAEVLRVMSKGRRFLLLTTVVAFLLAVALALFLPKVYQARVTLLPQPRAVGNSMFLAQLSGSIGLPLSGGETQEEIYSEIIRSDLILEKMLQQTWPTENGERRTTLYKALGYEDESEESTARILSTLKLGVVGFQRSQMNGFMEITVDFPRDRLIASALANALADSLTAFVQYQHKNSARERRVYIEDRLATTSAELDAIQDSLTQFTLSNKAYAASPRLNRIHQDIVRRVNAKSSTWIELTRQLELTRLEESDTSLRVAVLDRARPPLRPVSPKRRIIVVVGTFLGFVLGLSFLLLREKFAEIRATA